MIDFHTHILPGMDDGSRDTEQSLHMLRQMTRQGVDTLVATSHYYQRENTPREYVQRRNQALRELQLATSGDYPRLIMGAEVAYFPGISSCADLELLCIEGTSTLLLEMPFRPWSRRMMAELDALSSRCTVVLAHIERYWYFQSPAVHRYLKEGHVFLQINGAGLFFWPVSAVELHFLRRGWVQVIGSDCHGSRFRPPCMGYARKKLCRKLGEEALHRLDSGMRTLIGQ